ncbi:MAG: HYR domain-containing protein [Saprospirales bacterium]|nr:HYR domain-containing protein [Saprospirales bacterium]
MKQTYNSRLLRISGLLLGVLVWLANQGNPPTGRTGAPFDGHCNGCHTGNQNGFNGTVDVTGLPSTIEANTTYPLLITLTPTAGSPVRGGFQLVVVDGNNANAGDLTAGNAQSGTEFFMSREYLEHRGAKNFTGGGPASWTFNWKSPVTANGNTIKLYFIGNFTNNNGNDSGDYPIDFSDTYSFNGPPPVSAFISNSTNVTCAGLSNGNATVEPSGGVAPYTYLWSNNQTAQTAINLAAGTYTVIVTGSSGTGTATASVTITQPPILIASGTVSGILTCTNTSVTATASASGGTPPYDVDWSNGTSGTQTQLTAPGSYSFTVTDANGCTKVASVNASGNLLPPSVEAGPPATLNCNQPTAVLNGAGSSAGAAFSYLWTASNGGNIVSGATTLTPVVNAAGTYTLVVTNANNGCTASDNTTVTSNIAPPSVTTTGGTLTCAATTTTVSVSTNAGAPVFQWTGPNAFSSSQQNPTVNTPGTYTVTVTSSSSGCTATGTATVNQNTAPPVASVATPALLTCLATSIQLNGTASSQGANFSYSWTTSSGNIAAGANTLTPTVTAPGTYTLVILDNDNGCSATAAVSVAQNVAPPTATLTPGILNCTTTTTQITLTTNANPGAYAWSGPGNFTATVQNPAVNTPGNYTVTITDGSNGCTAAFTTTVNQNVTPPVASVATPGNLNCQTTSLQLNGAASSQGASFSYAWSTSNGSITAGANTLTPTVNAPGEYTLLVTNTANGCTATALATVVQSPPVTAAIGNVVNISCTGGSNGSAVASGGGGTGAFTYLWSNSASTAQVNNLSAGTYGVTVADAANCTATASVTITQPPQLNANATATAITSAGATDGTATAAPSGGTPGYTYNWSTAATTAIITGLAPGNYTVSVTDNNGCSAVQTVTVNNFNCTITATATVMHLTCNGAANGSATANVSGAALPVTYLWSNGDTTATTTNLASGTYTVQITDASNCPTQLSVNITSPAALFANATATNQTAVGVNDGTATAQPTGGTAPYSYSWSNSSAMQTIAGLAPGPYTVTVRDANDCTTVQTVQVNAFNCTLSATISASNVSCPGGNDGQATAVPVSGTAPIQYVWSSGDTTSTATNLPTGAYTVSITDAAGCQTTSTVTIVSNDTQAPEIICPSSPITACPGAIVQYPLPPVSDNCSLNGAQPELIAGLPSGSVFPVGQTVQVFRITDASGNSATCSFSVNVGPPVNVVLDGFTPDVNNAGVGSINVTASAGTGNLVFAWKKDGLAFASTEDLSGLMAGVYTLLVTDANGCIAELPAVTIDNTVGTGEPGDNIRVRVIPNPATWNLRLEIPGTPPDVIQLIDMHGRLLRVLEPADWTTGIDVSKMPAGLHYLRMVEHSGNAVLIKWIKAD